GLGRGPQFHAHHLHGDAVRHLVLLCGLALYGRRPFPWLSPSGDLWPRCPARHLVALSHVAAGQVQSRHGRHPLCHSDQGHLLDPVRRVPAQIRLLRGNLDPAHGLYLGDVGGLPCLHRPHRFYSLSAAAPADAAAEDREPSKATIITTKTGESNVRPNRKLLAMTVSLQALMVCGAVAQTTEWAGGFDEIV